MTVTCILKLEYIQEYIKQLVLPIPFLQVPLLENE